LQYLPEQFGPWKKVYDLIARTSPSIGSARALDGLAEGLTRILLQDPAATTPAYDGIWGDMPAGVFPDEWPLQRTLDFFAEIGVYALLLALPEADGSWVFTESHRQAPPASASTSPLLSSDGDGGEMQAEDGLDEARDPGGRAT